jgi:uncharacterized protein YdeI (YjbR/CyaY-like superfamily)
MHTDSRIDDYIEKSADFAKPILTHLRKLVHKACPQVEEKWKWSFPNFDYKGPLCSMAAFKQHCSFGLWKAKIMEDSEFFKGANKEGMGHLGRITSLKELPPDKVIISYIKEAMRLNDEDIKLPKAKPATKKDLKIPPNFKAALSANKKAKSTFDSFSYSGQKEYVEWVTEAKTTETRDKRLEQAIEWMAEGKSRHWKYKK